MTLVKELRGGVYPCDLEEHTSGYDITAADELMARAADRIEALEKALRAVDRDIQKGNYYPTVAIGKLIDTALIPKPQGSLLAGEP